MALSSSTCLMRAHSPGNLYNPRKTKAIQRKKRTHAVFIYVSSAIKIFDVINLKRFFLKRINIRNLIIIWIEIKKISNGAHSMLSSGRIMRRLLKCRSFCFSIILYNRIFGVIHSLNGCAHFVFFFLPFEFVWKIFHLNVNKRKKIATRKLKTNMISMRTILSWWLCGLVVMVVVLWCFDEGIEQHSTAISSWKQLFFYINNGQQKQYNHELCVRIVLRC